MEDAVLISPNESDEEEIEDKGESKDDGREGEEEEENVLKFLDSLDSYIALFDSLSSTLRQGWFELASARHSMGASRISSVLFNHKPQSAATTLQVTKSFAESPSVSELHYTLSKWASLGENKCSSREEDVGELQQKTNGSQLRHRGSSQVEGIQETSSVTNGSLTTVDDNVQRERSKSLSVFGTLVSPKLRSSQVSFETALETIVEIANMRSSMLSAFSQLQKGKEASD